MGCHGHRTDLRNSDQSYFGEAVSPWGGAGGIACKAVEAPNLKGTGEGAGKIAGEAFKAPNLEPGAGEIAGVAFEAPMKGVGEGTGEIGMAFEAP